MAEEIYNRTIFKRFFEKNDPAVLAWAENVLAKVGGMGILPIHIKKDSEDFKAYWGSICHLFALIVLYSRQYNEIDTNKILFELFIENRGLVTNEITTLEQMQYLFDNYVEEYRKRGRIDIVSKEGTILGELLRLIQYQNLDEFIFALLMSRDTGWAMGYSSPTWNRTDTVLNITKGYETTESIQDLSKYPLVNPTGVVIVKDTDNDGNPIQAMSFTGNTVTGISSANDKSKLLIVSEDLAYQIQFKVKVSSTTDQKLRFGVQVYDQLQRPMQCIEAFTIKGQSPKESNNFVKDTDGGNGNLNFPIANVYYQCTGIISKVNRSFAGELKLNFPYGRGLKFQPGAKYLSLELIQDRTTVANAITGVYVYDIKIKPIFLPFYQGYLGEKNVIASYFKNNSLSSENTVKQFIENYLISYKNIFGGSEIFKNELVLVRFKTFTGKGVYIQGATITVNNNTLTTDINGEATLQLYPGDYLMSVEKDKFLPIVDQTLSIYEQEEQVIYIPLEGELYERKITFAVRDSNNLPVAGATVLFNEKFATTGSDGTAVFYAFPGLYAYTVEKDRYYKVEKSVLVQDDMIEEVTLLIIPLYTLTFVVKNDETPVPEAIVTIGGKTAQTDSTGTAVIQEILGGNYTYSVEKKDWLPVSSPITVDEDATINIALSPVPTYDITFLVNDYNPTTGLKTPLQGVTVSYAGITKETGADGTAVFIVKQATYDYVVSYPGHVNQQGSHLAQADTTITIDLPQNQYETTIKVLGVNNSPISGATVSIGDQTLITQSNGTVVFNLTNGLYEYRVNYTEYHEQQGNFTVAGGPQEIVVNLDQKKYQITFTVREEGSISVGATVVLGDSSIVTNDLGQAIFSVPIGTYSFSVSKTNYITQTGSIDMIGLPVSREINLVKKSSVVTFSVWDDSGNPVSGATIVVAGQTASTGGNGKREFTIKVGSYDYTASKLPDFQEQSGRVNVTENNQNVNVYLSNKVYNVIVTVKSPKGRTISGATISISGKQATTSSNGQATLRDFKNGTYLLSASASNYSTYSTNVVVSGADRYIDIVLEYTLTSSTISVMKEGSALTGQTVSINIYDKHGDFYNSSTETTNNYGRVSYTGPSGGTGRVTINNSECVAFTDVSVSTGSGMTFYLWKALILRTSNTSSIPSGLGSSDYDFEPNVYPYRLRCCPGAKNNPSSISSRLLSISCSGMTSIQAILQWPASFSISGNTGVFKNCTNLSSIAAGSPRISGNVQQWFMGCTSLTSVPNGLFVNMTGNNATEAFRGCTKLTNTGSGALVPLNTIYHNSMFRECSSLTTIGDSLFGKGGGTDDFHAVFMGCTSFTNAGNFNSTNSPFKRSTEALYMQWTFADCSSLTSVTVLWFRYCTKITSFEGCFERCTSLNGGYSMGMFAWATSVKNFSTTFYGCTMLGDPDAEFPKTVTNINGVFQNCKNLTSLENCTLEYHNALVSMHNAFAGSGVTKVPFSFLNSCYSLTNAKGAFQNCTNLTEFGWQRYDNSNPVISGVTYRIRDCNTFSNTSFASTSYPALDCTSMFEGCTNLVTGTGPYASTPWKVSIWGSLGKVIGKVNVNRMFYGCSKLGAVPGYNPNYSIAGTNFVQMTDSTGSNITSHQNTFTGTDVAYNVPSGWA